MSYVDGFVVPVQKKKLDDYRKISRKAGRIWKEHGAIEYVECVSDDVKKGKVTSFPQSVQLKRNETVVFSYIVYRSRTWVPRSALLHCEEGSPWRFRTGS